MNNKKKWPMWLKLTLGLITIYILMAIFFAIIINIGGDDNCILLNWGVYLPKPLNRNNIIYTDGRDWERLDIYTYSKEGIEEVIRSKYVTLINESNIKDVENCLNKFEEFLNYKEKDIYNKNINRELLLTNENYFAIIPRENDNRTWLLLIVDLKANTMYCFGNY